MQRAEQSKMEPSRDDFCHPYRPYDIQLGFMQNLYDCLESGKVGIFESPTGTGKTLSLICGALTWLRDHNRRELDHMLSTNIDDGDDWLLAAENETRRREFLRERKELEEMLGSLRQKELARKNAQTEARVSKKARIVPATEGTNLSDGDDEFLLDNYESDQDKHSTKDVSTLSSSTLALLDQLKPIARNNEEEEQKDCIKVIFCSRTHSQLTQFVHELRRVTPPPGLPSGALEQQLKQSVKHLPLGSRKNLCINEKVSRLSATMAINERCLELQKPKVAKEHKCKFLPTKDDREKVEKFGHRAIATIHDIEDIASLGRSMSICPYYASRSAIPTSEVLTLPYPLLLQKSARDALGVKVKDNIIVIDEAHNLMDAIADTLSTSLSLVSLDLATKQVMTYVQKYKNRLKGQNRMYVTQVIRLLNSLTDCLRNAIATRSGEISITAARLMGGKGVDQIKPHKLLQYLLQSKLAHKVEGYTEAHEDVSTTLRSKGVLLQFQNFLSALMNPQSEGRFFVTKQDDDVVVRYTLLDPREHFRDIVNDARAVILAGGTMSPMSDYSDYLFSYLDSRLRTFSFGHVIPKHNLMVESITVSASGVEFDFTFEKRRSEEMISDLGRTLVRICCKVPDGVVVFFPSYDYLAQVMSVWRTGLLNELKDTKQVFEESRDVSVDELLREYAQAIDANRGGLMLSVIGGKLSEGINFSDRLGRAVVAVGLPFPNIHGAEWRAKIEHIEQIRYQQCQGMSENQSKAAGKAAGRDFYENACMRAVNQSIGRAIRHKNDYAVVLLLDRRFATERIRKKLPQWIQTSMIERTHRSWSSVEEDLQVFFEGKA